METVPLDVSVKEGKSDSQVLELEKEDNSFSLSSNAGTADLSKYFAVDSSSQEIKDAEGIDFFNVLAESSKNTNEEEAFIIREQSNPEIESQKTDSLQINLETEDLNDFKCSPGDENNEKNPTPILLKFFSEDKSGKDKDGKEFFDKISTDKIAMDFSALKINEPIVNKSNVESDLNLPASNSETEEAWIPSERTKQILEAIITTNSFSPDKSDVTAPVVMIEEEMDDPIKILLTECNSPFAQQRKVLTANDVSENEDGLKKLMENRCYHAAINLTKRLLISYGQGPGSGSKLCNHTPFSLKLWYTRLALFVKLKKFSLAEVESAAFGDLDKPDLYFEFYPDVYEGKKGSMVPFALRLLLAELPQYQGNYQIALDNLYRILNTIQKIINNVQNGYAEDGSIIESSDSRKTASLEIWRKRETSVLFSILNCVLTQKDYILAVSIAKMLIEKAASDTADLHAALGRIYLQLGDVQCAESCFKKALAVAEENSQEFKIEEFVNNAFLAIASDENEKAFKYFEQAYALKPDAMIVNNMAVCKLYTGQLKESLRLLESAIEASPLSCLHDGLLFNVCTLYELESSRCPQKKLAMLELVSKYAGDAFNVNCLKIQTVKT